MRTFANKLLENLAQNRVHHFYDIWHPADSGADRAALFWLIHKQHKLKPNKFPTDQKNSLVIFSAAKRISLHVLFELFPKYLDMN